MQILSNGVHLEFDTFGVPTDKAMLLISGLNTPMTRWTPDFCEQLAARGFYVIRYDNRDCGLSTHFDEIKTASSLHLLLSRLLGRRSKPPYALNEMAKDAVGLLDALGVESAHIVGRSLGGMIGQILAATYPEKTRSLTIIMSTTGNRRLPWPSIMVLKRMLIKKPNPYVDLAGYLKHRVAYTQAIASKRYPLAPFFIRSRVLEDIKRSGYHPGAARRQFAALLDAGDIRPISRKITTPTLIIHGDADDLLPLECGVDVYRNISGSRLKIIQDMGHSLQPEFYDEIIDEVSCHARQQPASYEPRWLHALTTATTEFE